MKKPKVWIDIIDDPVEQNIPTPETTKWKLFRYENEMALNTNTFHTFDIVLQHLKQHMTLVTERLTGIKLLDVELPQQDAAKILKDQTPRELTSKTILPRAVVLFDQEGMVEPLISIPTMQRMNRSGAGMSYAICTVRATDPKHLPEPYTWFKDINFSLSANPRWTAFTLKFNILLNTYAQGREVYKAMQDFFPIGEITPIYAEKRKRSRYGEAEFIPYTLESEIPNHVVNVMKRTFDIPETEEEDTNTQHDYDLLQILQTWSDNRIDYKMMGGERIFRFVTSYASPIHLTCNSINFGMVPNNRAGHSIVSTEFNVMYLELSPFLLSASLLKLNPENRANQGDPNEEGLKVYTLPFTEQMDSLTIWNREALQYEKEDWKIIQDISQEGNYYVKASYMEISLWDWILEEDHFREYIYDLYQQRETLNFSQYFRVEIKRGKMLSKQDPSVGHDSGIEIDYDSMVFRDPLGAPQMTMYLAFYIQKSHFQWWKEQKGYLHPRNLSGIRNPHQTVT